MAVKEVKRPILASFFVMGFTNSTNSENSPQILPFPVEKQPSQLSIHIDDTDIGEFYRQYYSLVYRRCLAMLGNSEDAQDAAHDVFEKIHEQKSKGQLNIPYPKTYLSTAAKNMGINIKKRERRELNELYDMATNGSINWFIERGSGEGKAKWEAGIADKGYEQAEAEIIVQAILEEQDETTRKIYFYKYHDDMTLEQTGEAVGLKKSAVQKRLKNLEAQVK